MYNYVIHRKQEKDVIPTSQRMWVIKRWRSRLLMPNIYWNHWELIIHVSSASEPKLVAEQGKEIYGLSKVSQILD